MRLMVLACLGALFAKLERPKAFTAPSTSEPLAHQLTSISLTGIGEHEAREARAALQRALPPRVIGGSISTGPRSYRPKQREQKKVGRFASFTSMVKDVATNPRVLIAEIAVIVIFSAVFEKLEHKARVRFARSGRETGAEILNALFKEITILGFVAFIIFLFTHTGTADKIAPMVLKTDCIQISGHNPLSATFETVHMIIFMLLVVLLAQAAAMFRASEYEADKWASFERTPAYGPSKWSLETALVNQGYVERIHDGDGAPGENLVEKKPFKYGASIMDGLRLKGRFLHKLIMFRALRHEFLFPSKATAAPGRETRGVPDPCLFSFEQYLRSRMGNVVLSLLHVDRWTWLITLGLLGFPLYLCKMNPWIPSEAVNFLAAWFVGLLGLALTVVVGLDTKKLTPTVPTGAKNILALFSKDGVQMLRRTKLPGWSGKEMRGEDGTLAVGLPPALQGQKPMLSTSTAKQIFRVICFLQAVSVTSLILSHITSPLTGRLETILYLGAWIEWPVMLFVLVPVIIRKLTIRGSVEDQKDMKLVDEVTAHAKECILRDYARLVQVQGFEGRAAETMEGWTLSDGDAWSSRQAMQATTEGLKQFDRLSPIERREIWDMFSSWDDNGNGTCEGEEMASAFSSLGCEHCDRVVNNLIRLVDYDSANSVSWMKFKAIFGLATSMRPDEELRGDLRVAFTKLDPESKGSLTVFELADGFRNMGIGITLDDVANLLYQHFKTAKPLITRENFVDWVVADRVSVLQSGMEGHGDKH